MSAHKIQAGKVFLTPGYRNSKLRIPAAMLRNQFRGSNQVIWRTVVGLLPLGIALGRFCEQRFAARANDRKGGIMYCCTQPDIEDSHVRCLGEWKYGTPSLL